ncbi:cupin domain-containing protein [Rhodococcus sp. HNM0569]|uniref:cupin domain-containing protein n=1 Tax=Rhodococcus sp. HNM0569 TaxID=2716340 RepID=UPI00146D55D5|nr:cupin domain-containing protein [Rhodococcus sp. HNM0569]NLU82536.1 cupin domain-containing protein [Rhodococcus sp. HNM0569]
MEKKSLTALARQQLKLATASSSGRSSATVYGGHQRSLRQTLVALQSGEYMREHESPGEATLVVLEGTLNLIAGDDVWKGSAGDFLAIPDTRHSVEALDDVVFLLTVAM